MSSDKSQEQVKLGYSSPQNSSFEGEIQTGYSREEWDSLSAGAKDEIIDSELYDLVDIWVIQEDRD
jgi:hypothetical protein